MQEHEDYIDETELAALLRAAELTAGEKLSNLSADEAAALTEWIKANPDHERWKNALSDEKRLALLLAEYRLYKNVQAEEWDEFKRLNLQERDAASPAKVRYLRTGWFRYAAAVIVIMCGVGTYLLFQKNNKPAMLTTTQKVIDKVDVAPGRDGAVLTLADGTKMVLDSMGNGIIANQNGTQVVLEDGQLAYDPTAGKAAETVMYNTMSTPKGRQFKVTLPDGTRVWLNSASSIRYPTVFVGKERKVDIAGEVYFEVAQNIKMPFKVKVKDKAEILVLGTNFNINAYENESSIKTTLLKGSVKVNTNINAYTLSPGQQAQVTANDKVSIVENADIAKVMAWKNGYFNFNDADLYEVMRQLERWYDIQVVYAKPLRAVEFSGELQRSLSLSQVLEALQHMNIKFKIEESRRLIIGI